MPGPAPTTFGPAPVPREAKCSAPDALIEVGGLGAPGTTFIPAAWVAAALDAADNDVDVEHRGCAQSPDPERANGLLCHPVTGALVEGEVPANLSPQGAAGARRTGTAERETPGYRIPAAMRRFVFLRDGSCRFPGCSTPARQCDLDHARAWPAGPTAPTNLIALCRRHHRIKQRPGWTVRLEDDGRVRWRDPSGREHVTWPVDHLHLMTTCVPRQRSSTPGRPDQVLGPARLPDACWSLENELAQLLHEESCTPWARALRQRLRNRDVVEFERVQDPDTSSELGLGRELVWTGSPWDTFVVDMPTLPPPEPEPIPF